MPLVDMELRLLAISDLAIKVTPDDIDVDEPKTAWLPKSQIEYTTIGLMLVSVSMPEWLAIDKGLV